MARSDTTHAGRTLAEMVFSQPRGVPRKVDMRHFPGWPQDQFYVRPPTGTDYAAWEQAGVSFDKKGRAHVKQNPARKAALIQICLCDEEGRLIFSPDQVKELAKIDSDVLSYWFRQSLNAADPRPEEEDEDEDEPGN